MGGVVQLVHVSFTPDLVAVDVVHLVDLGRTRVSRDRADVGEDSTRVVCCGGASRTPDLRPRLVTGLSGSAPICHTRPRFGIGDSRGSPQPGWIKVV